MKLKVSPRVSGAGELGNWGVVRREGTESPERSWGMAGRAMLVLFLLSPGLLWIPGWQPVEAGMKLGKVRQLPCILEVPPVPSKTLEGDLGLQRQHIQLVLSSSESQTLPHQAGSATFLLQDRAGVLLPHVDEAPDQLECTMTRYFTHNMQILWPGLPRRQAQLPTWYVVTVTHTGGRFRISTFCFQPAQGPGPAPLSGVFSLHTKDPRVQVRPQETVFLACGFSVDHALEAVDVSWVLQQKGGQRRELLTYSGKQGRLTHLHKQAEAFPAEIPRGNASIRLANVAVKDAGNYVCSASAAGLRLELPCEVAVVEPPKVTLSPQSQVLTLEEGQEQKLVCEVSRYYPLEAHTQWLREPLEGRMLPEVVKNVLFGNHRQSGDGTYSISSYFLLKASRRDDGVRYTCRVEHQGLRFPIRKSITILVTEKFGYGLWLFLFILAVLMLLLVVLLKYLKQGKGQCLFFGVLWEKKGGKSATPIAPATRRAALQSSSIQNCMAYRMVYTPILSYP
ncbi:tapasin-related protein-like isoform X2 [Antechinus flavipes]|uniref:tapasin-related protein-like isoform X2 n=1 Tax=Antechinus flavipes TaxID=38775 RepID=UPI002235F325|nr:tapasin-related protein-like isoform X2 [Antechinus flavipes]